MKLNYKRTVLIGLAFMSILAFWQFYDQVIPYLLEYVFKLDTFSANAIMSVDNVLAVFMLPLFGALSDRTRSPLGRRTPYILFGTLAAVALMVGIGIFADNGNFIGFIAGLMALLVVMAIYRSPAVAYMPDVTEKPLRSKGNAVVNLVGYIGGIFATVVMMIMLKSEKNTEGASVYSEGQSFLPVFIVIAIFMLLSVLVMVLTVNEKRVVAESGVKDDATDENKSFGKLPKPVYRSLVLILLSVFLWYMAYNAVTTAFSRYCIDAWGTDLGTSSGYLLIATVAAIAAFVPLGFLSGAIGRKNSVLLGIALMTIGFASIMFVRGETPLMYAIFAVVGIGWASINVNSFPMVVEMSNGSDIGKYTGFYYTFSMAAQIITPLFSGFLIKALPIGYKILFPYAICFAALSFVTMLFVKHGDSRPETRKSIIENFDVGD